MQSTQWNWIKNWYQHTADYIYLFSETWTFLWKNRSCPMFSKPPVPANLFGCTPTKLAQQPARSATMLYAGKLYGIGLDAHQYQENSAAPDTTFYVLRIGHVPYTDAQWQNPAWCQNIENRIAAVRGQIFGISNAAAALYDVIEEYSDDFPEMLQKEQMEQLNIIKGNCCKLMRPSLCCQEISKYYQKADVSPETIFLDREMSNFVESCRNVLGRTVRLRFSSEPYLSISVNRNRFLCAMLYIVSDLCRQFPGHSDLNMTASAQGEEVLLTLLCEAEGTNDIPKRHSAEPALYAPQLLTPEEQVIRLFCQTYHITRFTAVSENKSTCTLRFPPCPTSGPLHLHSPIQKLQDDAFSLYQLILSDISSYRFY